MKNYIIFCIIFITVILIYYNPNYSHFESSNFRLQKKLFYNSDDVSFQKLKLLENNYKVILSEMPPFDMSKVTIKRKMNEWVDNLENNPFFDKMKNTDTWIEGCDEQKNIWFNYPLLFNDQIMGKSDIKCPKTILLLKSCGIKINVAGFSALMPNTRLLTHTDPIGPSHNSAGVNMLLSGENSYLCIVNNEKDTKHLHIPGKATIFNNELKHYASNEGSIIRYILFMDIKI